MPLRIGHEEEEQQPTVSPLAAEAAAGAGQQAAPRRRYDGDTVQRAIALASRLQSEHQETMSSAQIEAIGAEVGLEPAFVRQALALLDAEQTPQRAAASEVVTRRAAERSGGRRRIRRLSRARKGAAVGVVFAYAALVLAILSSWPNPGTEMLWTAFFVGPALAIFLGAGLNSKRLGLFGGGSLATALFAAVVMHELNEGRFNGPFLGPWLLMTLSGALVGGGSAVLRQKWPRISASVTDLVLRVFPALEDPQPELR